MKNKSQHSGKIFLIIVLCIYIMIRNILSNGPAALMTFIIPDMNITFTESGMMMSVMTLFTGVFVIIGSIIIDKIGAIKTVIVSMLCFGVDGLISLLLHDFAFVIIGRTFTGIGYGMSICAVTGLTAALFDKKYYSIVNSVSSILNSLGMTIAFIILVPVSILLGSWRNETMLWASISAVCALLLIFWSKNKIDTTKIISKKNIKLADSLIAAMKYKEVWYATIIMFGCMWIYTCLLTYLPVFLNGYHKVAVEIASAITGIIPLVGIAGALLTGVFYRIIKQKKLMMIALIVLLFISAVGVALLRAGIVQSICIALVGFCFNGFSIVMVTAIMQLKNITPSVVTGAVGIMTGISSLLAFFSPFVFNALETSVGMQATFFIMSLLMVPAVIFVLIFPNSIDKPVGLTVAADVTIKTL